MARRKITEGVDIEADELPDLTPQQMKFVEGLVAGKTASDAYRAAYDCSNYQPASIWTNAAQLKAHAKVRLWLDALQAAGFTRVSCTRDEHLTELERLRNVAEREGNLGAAVQAEQLRGKVAGHYVERIEASVEPTNHADRLRKIAEDKPELTPLIEAIAAKHGLAIGKPEGETAH